MEIDAPVPAATRTMRGAAARPPVAFFGGVAAAVVALDQATKALVRAAFSIGETWPDGFDLIRLTHVENTGAAFGIFEGAGALLVVSSIVGVAVVLAFLYLAPREDRVYSAALALVLGGAAGNLIDRVARGSVTDFIDPTHYPAFNLADSAIVVGVFTLLALALIGERREGRD